jgi:hypothetical protein
MLPVSAPDMIAATVAVDDAQATRLGALGRKPATRLLMLITGRL